MDEAEFEGEMVALDGDGGVDAAGVEVEVVELIGWEDGDGAVCRVAELKGALGSVVEDHAGAEDLCEGTGGVTAESLHLPEAILSGDEALGDDEVVERGGVDVWDAVGVSLDGDGRSEAGDGEATVELGEGVAEGFVGPEAGGEEEEEQEQEGDEEGYSDIARKGRGAGLSVVGIDRVLGEEFVAEEQVCVRGIGLGCHVLGKV